jgi:hypothetical protein
MQTQNTEPNNLAKETSLFPQLDVNLHKPFLFKI